MPKNTKLLEKVKELEELENKEKELKEEKTEIDELNDLTDNEDEKITITKKKRVLTDQQKENLAKGRSLAHQKKREETAKKKLEEVEIENEVRRRLASYKKQLEDKIVTKAISIKKKEIKKHSVLEDVSDDDTSITKIKKIVKANKENKEKPREPVTEAREIPQSKAPPTNNIIWF